MVNAWMQMVKKVRSEMGKKVHLKDILKEAKKRYRSGKAAVKKVVRKTVRRRKSKGKRKTAKRKSGKRKSSKRKSGKRRR